MAATTTVRCALKTCAIAALLPFGIGAIAVSTPTFVEAAESHDTAKRANRRGNKGGRTNGRVRGDGLGDEDRHEKVGSGFLDSHGGGIIGDDETTDEDVRDRSRDRSRDRRERRRAAAMTARLAAYQIAQTDVSQSRAEALRLYAIYERLNAMTTDQRFQAYPDGGYNAALRDAAIRYNNAVSSFQIAEATAAQTLASLTNGRDLTGSALAELNALLGQ